MCDDNFALSMGIYVLYKNRTADKFHFILGGPIKLRTGLKATRFITRATPMQPNKISMMQTGKYEFTYGLCDINMIKKALTAKYRSKLSICRIVLTSIIQSHNYS